MKARDVHMAALFQSAHLNMVDAFTHQVYARELTATIDCNSAECTCTRAPETEHNSAESLSERFQQAQTGAVLLPEIGGPARLLKSAAPTIACE